MARLRNVKICAVVHVLPGLKVVALVPLVIPSFTAQPMAALKGELSATSVKPRSVFSIHFAKTDVTRSSYTTLTAIVRSMSENPPEKAKPDQVGT